MPKQLTAFELLSLIREVQDAARKLRPDRGMSKSEKAKCRKLATLLLGREPTPDELRMLTYE